MIAPSQNLAKSYLTYIAYINFLWFLTILLFLEIWIVIKKVDVVNHSLLTGRLLLVPKYIYIIFTILLWNIQINKGRRKFGYLWKCQFFFFFFKVHVIANCCKSMKFFASFFLLLRWYKNQSLVLFQNEFRAVLLFW